MKVLMINGSPNKEGCTYTALREVAKALAAEGVDSEIVWLGNGPVRDCIGCGACGKTQNCVFDDDNLSALKKKCAEADGFVFGSPVYYAHPSGRILSVLDRLFFSGGAAFKGKPGAAVVSARRAGTTASIDVLNKYFSISQMPIIGSSYWNMVHGRKPEDVAEDAEGVQTMRNLGRNMAAYLKGETLPALNNEYSAWTHFVR